MSNGSTFFRDNFRVIVLTAGIMFGGWFIRSTWMAEQWQQQQAVELADIKKRLGEVEKKVEFIRGQFADR